MQQQVTVFNARVTGFETDGNGLNGSLSNVSLGGEAIAHG